MSNLAHSGQGGRKTLEAWIAEVLSDPEKKKDDGITIATCTHIALVHVAGQTEKEIHTTKLVAGTNHDPKSLANLFRDRANSDAQDIPGVQRYIVYAFYEGSPEPKNRFNLSITGALSYDGFASEGPDARGQIQQGMRLTESIVQGTFRQQGMVWQQTQGIMQMLASRLEKKEQDCQDLLEFVIDKMKEQVKLDHELRMKEMEFKQKQELNAALMKMAPSLVNSIAGRDVFTENAEDTALVHTLVDAFEKDPSMVDKIMELDLPPLVMGPLMKRIHQIKKKKESDAARIRELADSGGVSGEKEFAS